MTLARRRVGSAGSHLRGAGSPAASRPTALGFRWPAEWEPHAATWLSWPHHRPDWPGKADAIPWVYGEIARELGRVERVRLIVGSAGEQARATRVLAAAGADFEQVDFVRLCTDRSWARDNLPTFVVKRGALGAVKWRFDGWARYRNHAHDDAAGRAVAESWADRCWEPTVLVRGRARRVVLEGGAIDGDGQGTLLTSRDCLLDGPRARNRVLGPAGTEQVLAEHLGATRVIWLGAGIVGDDTSGHVDDYVRFVAPGVVVVGEESRRHDPNYRALAEAREHLRGARDACGRKLEVVSLPMPEPVLHQGQRLPASYANFYLANQLALVPTFNDPADRIALGRLAELLPGRRVVGIHCVDLVLGQGTLHCSTQQEPAVERRGAGSRRPRR